MTYHSNSSDWVQLDNSFTKPVRIFNGFFCFLVVLVGVVGNFFVCLVVIRTQLMRSSTNVLIASLAFVDLLQCLNLSTVFATLTTGEWMFGHAGCQISAYLVVCFVTVSLYLLALISVNRYTLIGHPTRYQQLFTTKNMVIMILATWVWAAVTAAPPLFGYEWAAYVFRKERCLCTMRFDKSIKYFLFVTSVVLLGPLIVIVISYWKMFKIIRRSRRQVNANYVMDSNPSSSESSGERSSSQISVKMAPDVNPPKKNIEKTFLGRKSDKDPGQTEMIWITLMLFVIVAIFFVVYVPTMTINLIEMVMPQYAINIWVDMLFTILAFANHAINPIVYGAMNKHYRAAFKHYLCIC